MNQRPSRECAAGGCVAIATVGTRCVRHQRAERRHEDRDRGSAHSRGYGRGWRKKRAVKLANEPLCRVCKARGRTTAATEVDHIVPKAQGGTDADDNLQPLCKSCHSRKTAREVLNP